MVGKKGMSPIIATILLIAFAVALGAMIMNWSSDLVAGGAKESTCNAVDLNPRKLCYEGNQISVDIANQGDVAIDGIILRIISNGIENDVKLNTRLESRDFIRKTVPAVKPDDYQVQLIPLIAAGEEIEACTFPAFETGTLPDCENI